MTSPSIELDLQLRLAAIDALRQITDLTDGVITRSRITEGFQFQGTRIAFADRGRGIWKPQLLGDTGAALSVLTSVARPGRAPAYDDGGVDADGLLAYRYQREGEDSRDNVAVRRAYEQQLPIIYFRGITEGIYSAIFPTYVVSDERADRTFRLRTIGATIQDPDLLTGADTLLVKSYMLQVVQRRLHQHRFRELVLSAYRRRCCVCQIEHDDLLDAAHIIGDREEHGAAEVPNGLALCKIHHSAYDANIMGIDPDRRIHIREDILEEVDGPMLKYGLQKMHDERIHVPNRADLQPKREYLGERFERFRAA